MGVHVRAVRQSDWDAWLPLWDGYSAFYGRSGANALDPEITRITWQRFFDEAEPMYALLAEVDGEVAGLTHFLMHRSTTAIAHVCYLQDLFTDARFRGRGVGRALIEAVYARARGAHCPRVYWQTHETNQTAMRLYDQVADKPGSIIYRKELS